MSRKLLLTLGTRLGGLLLGGWVLSVALRSAQATLSGALVRDCLPLLGLAAPWFCVPLFATALSWWLLFPPGSRLPLGEATLLSWIGLAVNWVLPVATLGGEVAKFELATRPSGARGRGRGVVAATLVVDKTTQVITQLVLVGVALAALSELSGRTSALAASGRGVVLVGLALGIFLWGQHAGMFGRTLRALGQGEHRFGEAANRLDAEIAAIYRRRLALSGALLCRLAFRLLFAAEIYWAFQLFDVDCPLTTLLLLEGVVQGARMSAFVVPAGIGVQEGALLAAGQLLGLPVEALMAAAVLKRLRELAVSLPALLVWQILRFRKGPAAANR